MPTDVEKALICASVGGGLCTTIGVLTCARAGEANNATVARQAAAPAARDLIDNSALLWVRFDSWGTRQFICHATHPNPTKSALSLCRGSLGGTGGACIVVVS